MAQDGYFHVSADSWECGPSMESLAKGARDLVSAGLNPTWLLLFDDVWQLCHNLTPLLAQTVHCAPIFDVYVFHVPPGGGVGWTPHRDRDDGGAPSIARQSFRDDDGMPKYATVWVALTDVTPVDSCIYCLPRCHDRHYFGPDDAEDPATAALDAGLRSIRALPAARGDVYVWSHRLLHWGGASSHKAVGPRIALSYAFADPGYERPVLSRGIKALPLPSWEERQVLVAYQMALYSEHVPLGDSEDLVASLLSRHRRRLTVAALDGLPGEVCERLMSRRRH